MNAYWSTCDGCTYCTTTDCTAVAYCGGSEPHDGPTHCDEHMPRAAS